ncbi:MAG: TonB-dependent receptor [Rheinheimera sp.]|nr:TonB-dependent receptor [Rheinheimera sp.]
MPISTKLRSVHTICLLAAAIQTVLAFPGYAAEDAENTEAGIERIVITGEKTSRSLLETASSVGVTTSERIEQEQLFDFSDVVQRTANVSSMYGNRGFTIRGIANESGAPNPLATVYLDGAAIPSQISESGPLDLWDISQVEIFRGPQSTIQGENALAGAVILTSNDPTADFSGRARVTLADPNDKRYAVALSGALTEDDSLQARLSAEKRDYDGFIRNITRNIGEDAQDNTSIRLKLLWQPVGLPGVSARLTHLDSERNGPYMYSYRRRPDANIGEFVNLSNRENKTLADGTFTTLDLRYQLNDRWQLSSVTARSNSDYQRAYDGDLTAADLSYGNTDEDYKNWSQELRLQYQDEQWRWLSGVYLSGRDNFNNNASVTNVDTPLPTIAAVLQGAGLDAQTAMLIAGMYGQALPVIPVDYRSVTPSESGNKAFFTDLEYSLTSQWTLLAGFRVDRERYQYGSETNTAFAGTLPDPKAFDPDFGLLYMAITGINQAVLGFVADAAGTVPQSERDFNAFLPKVGLRYQPDDSQSLALTLQRGYRSGGSSFNIARGQVFAFEPEFTNNYELAWRWQPTEQPLSLGTNVYYIDWQDKQVNASFGLNSFDRHTVNAGRSHLYGTEVELQYQLSAALETYLAWGYARTQYDQFELVDGGSVTDYSGQSFSYAPKNTFSAGFNWYPADGFALNINGNYRSSMLLEPGNSEVLSARTLLNARLSWQRNNWTVALYGQNLTDKRYIQYTWVEEPNEIVGTPRVVGLSVDYQW